MDAAVQVQDESFEAWYRREYRRVLATVTLATGDADLARDATDEAFARAYERWSRVRGMEQPGGWLYRVALNVARRAARRRALETRLLLRATRPAAPAPPELAIEVWDAVATLAPRARDALALRYVGGLTQAQVADALGIAPGTAARLLHDARAALVPLLADEADAVEVEEVGGD